MLRAYGGKLKKGEQGGRMESGETPRIRFLWSL